MSFEAPRGDDDIPEICFHKYLQVLSYAPEHFNTNPKPPQKEVAGSFLSLSPLERGLISNWTITFLKAGFRRFYPWTCFSLSLQTCFDFFQFFPVCLSCWPKSCCFENELELPEVTQSLKISLWLADTDSCSLLRITVYPFFVFPHTSGGGAPPLDGSVGHLKRPEQLVERSSARSCCSFAFISFVRLIRTTFSDQLTVTCSPIRV